jgi:SAM-dependent methyltransferase
MGETTWACVTCARHYAVINGMPMLIGEETRRRVLGEITFHDEEAGVYAAAQDLGSLRVQRAHTRFIQRVCRHLPPRAVVAELACGLGSGGALLLARGHHVIETDVSPGMLRQARENLAGQKLLDNTYLCGAEATELPFADGCLDGIVAMAAIHHLDTEQLLRLLREARRALKPGGVVAFGFERSAAAARVMPTLYGIAARLTGMSTSPEDAVFRGFTPDYLSVLFEAAGLTSVRVWPVWHLSGILHNGLRFVAAAQKQSPIPSVPRPVEELLLRIDDGIDQVPLLKWLCWNVDALAVTPKR